MKSKFLFLFLILFSSIAFAEDPVVIITPFSPQPIYDQCNSEYRRIVKEETTDLQICNAQWDIHSKKNFRCKQAVLEGTNSELYDNTVCRAYYLSFKVITRPTKEHPHPIYYPHPEHLPKYYHNDSPQHRNF